RDPEHGGIGGTRSTTLPVNGGTRSTAAPVNGGTRSTTLPVNGGTRSTTLPVNGGTRSTAAPALSGRASPAPLRAGAACAAAGSRGSGGGTGGSGRLRPRRRGHGAAAEPPGAGSGERGPGTGLRALLRFLVKQLDSGEVNVEELKRNLEYAASLLEAVYIDETRQMLDTEDELREMGSDAAVPSEVRDWLAATFTQQARAKGRRAEEKPKFRSIVHAVQAGIFVERMLRRLYTAVGPTYSSSVLNCLKSLDVWCFDVFTLNQMTEEHSLRTIVFELLTRHNLNSRFKIPAVFLNTLLDALETGYGKYRNPYHNQVHAADVTQTVHCFLVRTGMLHYLTELEVLAIIFAAAIHDYEHTGTTNSFHIQTKSDCAILYNDRSVLENHHISAAFRLMQDEEMNIFVNLTKDEFAELRALVIEMVLATDMSCHFQQVKSMKTALQQLE
ncbi:dual specificity calcium/calmodulin-dependent 3',5'-cyclic nucleotide phosphodiesterase 1B-like, partial [Pezoporus wallicus]|uniref:dual specificity calcium/calmodulin-dependent 3',5'-cyclic nucleotide phosphodiesterase 1B-like n=1 Tax=Pezoporus wallicus TaxID=35540 RepID=UPI00254BD2FD